MKSFAKTKVTFHEFQMYQYIHSLHLDFVPQFLSYDETTSTLTMQRIDGMSLSDMFGEKFENVPENIIEECRSIISSLYDAHVVYPDITGYNFILESKTDKVWLVDFEHSFFRGFSSYNQHNDFVQQFIKGKMCWNPYFA